jgi:UDP-N-acetyl-D-glucosamine dehydrogenase
MERSLQAKIASRSLRVGVIGLGYVGLPLATTFAEVGFDVTGIDTDQHKVDAANGGESYIPDISSSTLQSLLDTKRIHFTTDYTILKDIDAVSICVPTPLRKMFCLWP